VVSSTLATSPVQVRREVSIKRTGAKPVCCCCRATKVTRQPLPKAVVIVPAEMASGVMGCELLNGAKAEMRRALRL
jgi:hypothetical protein